MEAKIYDAAFDGSTRLEDKRSTIGFVIKASKKNVLCKAFRPVDFATSVEVEYKALMELLKTAIGLKVTRIHIRGDCKIVIDQLNGDQPVSESLELYNTECLNLLSRFEYYQLEWVGRKNNRTANRLSRRSLNPKGEKK